MKKLGILCHQLISNQKFLSMGININEICLKNRDIDCIVFHNDLGTLNIKNEFAIMASSQISNYDGVIIAIDYISAHMLRNCSLAKQKFFYIWNIDWHSLNRDMSFLSIFTDKDIELIARSEDHARIIGKTFKKPKYTIEEFDNEQLRNLLNA